MNVFRIAASDLGHWVTPVVSQFQSQRGRGGKKGRLIAASLNIGLSKIRLKIFLLSKYLHLNCKIWD